MAERAGRTTVYNDGLTSEYDTIVSDENKSLISEFVDYLRSVDKSPQTIKQYEAQLRVWACWNATNNNNTFFVDMKKRQFVKFFSYLQNDLGSSSSRVCSLRAVLSSFSNFIERIMDEEYPSFRNIVKVLEPVNKTAVREKSVIDDNKIAACLETLVQKKKYEAACVLAIIASSGMRKSEVIQMRASFFDEDHKIFGGLAYETDKIRTKGRSKAGKVISRIVFVDPFQKYFDLWMEERERLGIDCDWLFVRKTEDGYDQAAIGTIDSIAKTIEGALGETFYMHAIRHSFTTHLLRAGYPTSIVQKIIKWESADMVSIYDDRDTNEELTDFMQKMMSKSKNDD